MLFAVCVCACVSESFLKLNVPFCVGVLQFFLAFQKALSLPATAVSKESRFYVADVVMHTQKQSGFLAAGAHTTAAHFPLYDGCAHMSLLIDVLIGCGCVWLCGFTCSCNK